MSQNKPGAPVVSLNRVSEYFGYNYIWEIQSRMLHQSQGVIESPSFTDYDNNEWKFGVNATGRGPTSGGVRISLTLVRHGDPPRPVTGLISVQVKIETEETRNVPGFVESRTYISLPDFTEPRRIENLQCNYHYKDILGKMVFDCQFIIKKSLGPIKEASIGFAHILKDGAFADVKIISKDGKEYPAHKAILAARSRVFKTMLQVDMAEANNNIIDLSDFPAAVMVGFLEFIYTENTIIATDFFEWLRIADMYEVYGLKSLVETEIGKNITVENAVLIYHTSSLFRAQELKATVSLFIKRNSKAIAATPAIGEYAWSNPELIQELFQLVTG